MPEPIISTTPEPTGSATGSTATGSTATEKPPVQTQQQEEKPEEKPVQHADQKIHPVLLWYAVSVVAYALAFEKTCQDIENSPIGNGLFPADLATEIPNVVVTKDVNKTVEILNSGAQTAASAAAFAININNLDSTATHTAETETQDIVSAELTKLGLSGEEPEQE